MNQVGRNEACPCGSGKKYKFCHGQSNIIPFPGLTAEDLTMTPPDDGRTFREARGTPNLATGPLKELKALFDAKDFATVEEANTFLTKHVEAANHSPKDEFLGLSPHQMHQLLEAKIGAPGIVEVNFEAAGSATQSVPLQLMGVWLLQWLSTQDLKLTSVGYLPPLVAKLWWEETLMRLDFWGEEFEVPVRKESDSPLLIDVRNILASLGLTKVRLGLLSLTKKGKEFLQASAKDQYIWLYSAVARTMNWDDLKLEHLAQPHPLLQESWYFSLFLLQGFEAQGIDLQEAAELWLGAFPLVLKAYGPPKQETIPQGLRESLVSMVAFYNFEFMPRLLGLVDWIRPPERLAPKMVKLSELGRTFHRWLI